MMVSFFMVIYGLILGFLALAIITSNSFCIFVLRRVQVVNDAPKIFMMSLSIADLLIGVIGVLPMGGISMFVGDGGLKSLSGQPICSIIAVLMKSLFIIKLFSLLALNLDRYVAVTKALRYHTIMTYKMTLTVTLLIWILSLFASVMNGFVLRWRVAVEQVNLCIFKLNFGDVVSWLEIIFLSILPFLATILIYLRLAALARHHAAQIAVMPEAGVPNHHNNENKKNQAAIKATKTFRIMTFVFAMSWVPLFVTSFVASLEGNQSLLWIVRLSLPVTFCSGFCNIMVYFTREKEIFTASKTLLYPKLESCQQFLAQASTRLQQFTCCACTRACRHSPPMQTGGIPDDSVSEVRASQIQDEVSMQPTALFVQRNELELQSSLGNAGEEVLPHIKDSPV